MTIVIRKKNTAFNRRDRVKSVFSIFFLCFAEEGKSEMKESQFQSKVIKDLKNRFEGCIVMKNDASYIQGIPDLLVLYEGQWAALECKRSEKSKHQPNQDYYVERMNNMSFARYICPENAQEVLNDLERTFRAQGQTCNICSE